ncbi:DUF5926 family protein [Motilibacter aurantiacus]|uniref:DUF5926 family protein n=1 Tax=Motilibacter aurantiacus TaxID=2714955 RepID=UPI0014095D23|nr:DUF5926 family protein [Motilibacter aurantiacus]NHC46340.1 topoisomerase II [Motilibacter aurantiacus]
MPTSPASSPDTDVPVVGPRQPCPCGSGKRYKACHGKAAARESVRLVTRPFEGLAGEPDWVALREVVPAATAPLRLVDAPERQVSVATVLPMAWPAYVRADGHVFVALQVQGGSGDPSRDVAAALLRALEAEPGTPVPPEGLPGPGPRLQDLLAADAPLEVTVHEGFGFWMPEAGEDAPEVEAALSGEGLRAAVDRANAAATPTVRLVSVQAAYWCRMGEREHLRWALPEDEEALLDGLARLRAAGEDGVGTGTRLLGTFRAHGLLVPVWDIPLGTGADAVEDEAAALRARLDAALASTTALSAAERKARAGLQGRQLTLR